MYVMSCFAIMHYVYWCVRNKNAEFGCHICKKVLTSPVTTPCAHNFCKACLECVFAGMSHIKERTCQGRRTLRPRKNVMNCPLCSTDIAEFLQNLEVWLAALFARSIVMTYVFITLTDGVDNDKWNLTFKWLIFFTILLIQADMINCINSSFDR